MGINQVIGESNLAQAVQQKDEALAGQQLTAALRPDQTGKTNPAKEANTIQVILEAQRPAEASKSVFQSFMQKIAGSALANTALDFRTKMPQLVRSEPEGDGDGALKTEDNVVLSQTARNQLAGQTQGPVGGRIKINGRRPQSEGEQELAKEKETLEFEKNSLLSTLKTGQAPPQIRQKLEELEQKIRNLDREINDGIKEKGEQGQAGTPVGQTVENSEEDKKERVKNIRLSLEQGGNSPEDGQEEVQTEKQGLLNKYADLFSKQLTGPKVKSGQQTQELERQLREKGVPEKEIIGLENQLKKSYRQQVTEQLRDDFLNYTLANKIGKKGRDISATLLSHRLSATINDIENDPRLGGFDFGRADGLSGAMQENMDRVWEDMHYFLQDEFENVCINKVVSGKMNRALFDKLADLCGRSGFDADTFFDKTWPQKKSDLGLKPLEQPIEKFEGQLVSAEAREFGEGRKKKEERQADLTEAGTESDEDLLTNRLRAVYYKRALGGKALEIGTVLKLFQAKNGLVKLGVWSKELDQRVQDEALVLARKYLLDEIKNTYLDEASLVKLSGTPYQVLKKKRDGLLKNGEKLGMEFSSAELKEIKDAANRGIFQTCLCQVQALKILLEEDPADKKALAKGRELTALMKRLKEESGLTGEIPELTVDLDLNNQKRPLAAVA